NRRKRSRTVDGPLRAAAGRAVSIPEIRFVEFLPRERSSSSQSAHSTERFTIRRKAFTWAGVHSSHRITGIAVVSPPGHDPSFRAALILRCPSTTVPSLRASTGILKPYSRRDEHIRSTAGSFFLGFRA